MPYRRLPAWVLGFHGTDEDTVSKILTAPQKCLTESRNQYDWLGNGVYFWENDPIRARTYIEEKFERDRAKGKNQEKTPAVIGAVIDLGLCLNLYDQSALMELRAAYDITKRLFDARGMVMPSNKGGEDRLLRYLDRTVIQVTHALRMRAPEKTPPYDTVRSGFHEGGKIYEEAGFHAKNHIQIAVRNPACIKGFFLPRGLDGV